MGTKRIEYKKGDKIGSCIYIRDSDNINGRRRVTVRCSCGKIFIANPGALKSGNTLGCGCGAKKNAYKHGLSKHRIYAAWHAMNHRCYDKNVNGYDNYGGRGIKVCDEWRNDFKCFYDYMIKLDHVDDIKYSVDRINNEGNYEPGNIKMSTPKEQCSNRRTRKAYSNTGYVGVYKKSNGYMANVTHNNKLVHLGQFKTIEDAVKKRAEYISINKISNRRI